MSKKYYVKGKKYYVKGKEIDLDYWTILLTDIDALDEDDYEYATDIHGKILGVAWEMEL